MVDPLDARALRSRPRQALVPADDLDVCDIEDIADLDIIADEGAFALVDDAGGRFGIDAETGIITLSDMALLRVERGAVFPVRVRVPDASGAHEAVFHLRITGRIPAAAMSDGSDPLEAYYPTGVKAALDAAI
ncbi:MAG: hypothetical protein GC189_10875 [Alphaproteobacteria bacterium]|nr:hypothetical protein [Alphaproteobacteria bacterium]